MAFRLAPSDLDILMAILECRMLTAQQLAAFLNRGKKGVSDRTGQLVAQGLLEQTTRGHGQKRGRPQRVVLLSERGIDIVKDRGLIDPAVPNRDIIGKHINCQSHQLLLNWVRIHLMQVERVQPGLHVRFLAHNSPFLPPGFSGPSIFADPLPHTKGSQRIRNLWPDATFAIVDNEQGKALLFFLEVDMGTETLASPQRESTDIRQKILNYGDIFDTLAYKRCEKLFGFCFNGFRLLFMTDTFARVSTISSVVRQMPPADFIWLTDKNRMFKDGISADIWVRGGRIDASPHSILGSLSCRAPLK